jgi:2-oxoglutarate ferredoxin oxidoreductase subunit gamma
MLLCGQLLAYASMVEGKQVTWFPTYGAEVRGGAANCSVVISDRPVGSPVIDEADILVACSQPSLDRFHKIVSENGLVLYHSAIVDINERKTGVTYIGLDFSAIANSIDFPKSANMVALGALGALIKIAPESISAAMKNKFGSMRAGILELNEKAAGLGRNAV